MPLISIIIPVYNAEPFLDECFESIQHQTFSDWEIIAIDDASTDNSRQVLCRWAESFPEKIRTIFLSTNSRQGRARNEGLKLAQGYYVTYVDADDRLEPTFLSSLLDLSKKYSADVVRCRNYRFSATIQPSTLRGGGELCLGFCRAVDAGFGACGMLLTKSLCESVPWPEYVVAEDTVFTPLIYNRAHKIVLTSNQLYGYRLPHATATTNSPCLLADGMKTLILLSRSSLPRNLAFYCCLKILVNSMRNLMKSGWSSSKIYDLWIKSGASELITFLKNVPREEAWRQLREFSGKEKYYAQSLYKYLTERGGLWYFKLHYLFKQRNKK